MNLAFTYNLLNEVSSLRKALRFTSDIAGIYIFEVNWKRQGV